MNSNFRNRILKSEFREHTLYRSTLPVEYQQVEYLESTGTQYILLDVEKKKYVDLDITFMTTAKSERWIFGAGYSAFAQRWFSVSGSPYDWGFSWFNYSTSYGANYQITPHANRKFRAVCTGSDITMKLYENNVLITTAVGSRRAITDIGKVSLFGYYESETDKRLGKVRIYSCEVKVGDTKYYFIPCYRKSDNVAGMYDLVEGVFYTNEGTGTFVVGEDINNPVLTDKYSSYSEPINVECPEGYRECEYLELESYIPNKNYQAVEYLESDGNAFIRTDLSINNKVDFDITCSFVEPSRNVAERIMGQFNNASTGGSTGGYSLVRGSGSSNMEFFMRINSNPTYSATAVNVGNNVLRVVKEGNRFLYFAPDGTLTQETDLGTNLSETSTTVSPLYLYGTSFASSTPMQIGKVRIYSARYYTNGVDVANYVPAIRKSDNTYGMLDTVSGTFYTNAGSGSFSIGKKLNEIPYTFSSKAVGEVYNYSGEKYSRGSVQSNTYNIHNKIIKYIKDYDDSGNITHYLVPAYRMLPKDYQQVEYLESDGDGNSTRIFTGLWYDDSDYSYEVETKVHILQYKRFASVFGSEYVDENTNVLRIILHDTEEKGFLYYIDTKASLSTYSTYLTGLSSTAKPYILKYNYNEAYIDNIPAVKRTPKRGKTVSKKIWLFTEQFGNTCKCRMYYFKLWQGGSLVRDFVPCYRKSDNVAGMYDLVEGVFYTNEGTGEFIAGGSIEGSSNCLYDLIQRTDIPFDNSKVGQETDNPCNGVYYK